MTPPINAALLDQLLGNDDFVTVDQLAKAIDTTATMVMADLDRLRVCGCVLHTHPQHGAKMIDSGLGVWRDYLHWVDGRSKRESTRQIEVYTRVGSTQDVARKMVEASATAADGGIAIADEQTAGRGRMGRRWIAPPGSAVTFSRACVTEANLSVDHFMLATAVAVARAIEQVSGLDVKIKWPNDILVQDGKLAGILVERFKTEGGVDAAIIGIGINVALQPDQLTGELLRPAQTITSLAMCQRPIDRLAVLAAAVVQMDRALQVETTESLVEHWRNQSVTLDKLVTLKTNRQTLRAHVMDIDPYDGLIVRSEDGNVIHLPGATTTLL